MPAIMPPRSEYATTKPNSLRSLSFSQRRISQPAAKSQQAASDGAENQSQNCKSYTPRC